MKLKAHLAEIGFGKDCFEESGGVWDPSGGQGRWVSRKPIPPIARNFLGGPGAGLTAALDEEKDIWVDLVDCVHDC